MRTDRLPAMRRARFWLGAAFATAMVHLGAQAQPATEVRLGFVMGDKTHQGRAATHFAEAVGKATGGKLVVRPVGGAKLGSESQMQQALAAGTQELMLASTSSLTGQVKEMALWDAPFLFSDGKEADAILDGPIGTAVLSRLVDKGLVGLGYWENGFRQVTNSKRAVVRVEDLQGLSLRIPATPAYTEAFAALGATPVNVPFPQMYAALQSRSADGQEHPLNVIVAVKLYEVQGFLTLSNHSYTAWVLLASKKWWDGQQAAERQALIDAAKSAQAFGRQDSRDEAARALADLRARGMQIDEFTPAEVQHARAKLAAAYRSTANTVGAELWTQVEGSLQRLRR